MITLNWLQVGDMRQHAEHKGVLLVVDKVPNWDRHPEMRYEYHASGYRASTRHDLGAHANSKIARQACADFINAKTEGVTT